MRNKKGRQSEKEGKSSSGIGGIQIKKLKYIGVFLFTRKNNHQRK